MRLCVEIDIGDALGPNHGRMRFRETPTDGATELVLHHWRARRTASPFFPCAPDIGGRDGLPQASRVAFVEKEAGANGRLPTTCVDCR